MVKSTTGHVILDDSAKKVKEGTVLYSAGAVRELTAMLVTHVFDERPPPDVPCMQDWREKRLLDVLKEAFSGDPNNKIDGSMPWHKFMRREKAH